MPPSSLPVLIIGSGPAGLIMANQLALLGVQVRLIDRLPRPVTSSRAFTIHARTLELLGQMGLAKAFLDQSLKTYAMDYHFPTKDEIPKLDFTELDSIFPFCLTINQCDTESILRDHLASLRLQTEWNTKLISFEQNEAGLVTAVLEDVETGAQETVQTHWLIGCDGYYSVVRQQLGLPYDGDDYAGTMKMMDVPVEGFKDTHHSIHYYISKEHMLLINKLPGPNFRVLISDMGGVVPTEIARDAFQAVVDKHFHGQVQLGQPVWSTNFKIGKRLVNHYRQGSVFLVGDSAHINSPAGGQGMNVSMQDAFNLAWKLALVVRGEAHPSLLDSYEAERAPIAAQMLEGTQYIHSIIMAHGQGMEERIARLKADGWNKQAVNQIAGISYNYRAQEETAELAAGDRAPDTELTTGRRIYDFIQTDGYTLFLFSGVERNTADLTALVAQLENRYQASLAVRFIVPSGTGLLLNHMVVDDGAFHKRYKVGNTPTVFVVRPDAYIGYKGLASNPAGVLAYLDQHLTLKDES